MYLFLLIGMMASSNFALACYKTGKYMEAVTWCDHVLNRLSADGVHSIESTVRSCKGKAIAQMYLCRQNQRLLNTKWELLGHDTSSSQTKFGSKVLNRLSLAEWEKVCSQGLEAIQLLGEVLDSDKLDNEGSELLDLVMMDYSKETGEASKCNRCLLCRTIGDLPPMALKKLDSAEDSFHMSTGGQSIFSLQSFMYRKGSQIHFLFCKECLHIMTHYANICELFIKEINSIKAQPAKYDNNVYLGLVAFLIGSLSLICTGSVSNQKDVYTTFLSCRDIMLSHNNSNVKGALPKMYLVNIPKLWYVFRETSSELYRSFQNFNDVVALIANQQKASSGGDPHECDFFLTQTGTRYIILDFSSDK